MAEELTLPQEKQFPTTRLRLGLLQVGIIIAILYFISFYDYLLFHLLTEMITTAIAAAIFMLTWNSRKYQANNYYLFFGVAFLAVGLLSILHALAYRGMPVFSGTLTDANLATQLWLAIQYFLAITFFIAPFLLKKKLGTRVIFLGYFTALTFILLSIFFWKNFPVAYIEGKGLTTFKEVSEYIATFLFLSSIYLFYLRKDKMEWKIFRLMVFVLILMAASTIAFTLYIGVYSFFNIMGHLLRILAFYGIYLAFIEYSLMKPYNSIFKELHENKQILEYERNKLTNILDTMTDGIYITNKNRDIIYANPAIIKDFGIANGQKCYQYLHDRTDPCPWCKDRDVFKGKIMRWDWHYPKTGKTYDLIDCPLVTPDGIVTKMAIFRDISQQKKAQEEIIRAKEEWENTFNSVPDLIALLDDKHRILRVNRAMADKLKTSDEKCIGLNCYECVHNTASPISACPHSQTMADGKEHIAEVEEPNLGGTFLVSTTPFFNKNGKLAGSVHVARDITERKRIEKAKDEFVALSSHQLRTPLSNIRLSADLMLRGISGENSPEQKEFLEEIQKATKRMTILVNNLLNISRLEMGNFDVKAEPLDVTGAVSAIAREFRPLITEKGISFNLSLVPDLPIIYFDENIFRLILENLLSNSIRYTPKGGFINIGLYKDNSYIIFKIDDSGCGIPKHQKDEVFTKSFRADNAKALTSEGAGLGLYMVKSICQRIGADIWFESEVGKGTAFFVSIPVEEEKQMKMI